MRLSGHQTVSGVIDRALSEFIRTERNRRDAEIYERMPVTEDEFVTIGLGGPLDLDDDDIDYEELYGVKKSRRGESAE